MVTQPRDAGKAFVRLPRWVDGWLPQFTRSGQALLLELVLRSMDGHRAPQPALARASVRELTRATCIRMQTVRAALAELQDKDAVRRSGAARQRSTWHIQAPQPVYNLRLDMESGRSAATAAAGQTGAIVVSRGDYPDDVNNIRQGLIDGWKHRAKSCPDVYHYWPNEPGGQTARLLAMLMDLMDQSADAGVKACIGNIDTAKSVRPSQVNSGTWDAFIQKASKWTHEGHGFVGIHEYSFGALAWGCAGRNPQDMVDGNLPGPDRWPTRKDIMADPAANWHLHRYAPLEARAAKLGVPMFRMIATEGFWAEPADTAMLSGFLKGKYDLPHGPLRAAAANEGLSALLARRGPAQRGGLAPGLA